MTEDSNRQTVFEPTSGQLRNSTPYAVHSAKPVTVTTYMPSDTDEGKRDFSPTFPLLR